MISRIGSSVTPPAPSLPASSSRTATSKEERSWASPLRIFTLLNLATAGAARLLSETAGAPQPALPAPTPFPGTSGLPSPVPELPDSLASANVNYVTTQGATFTLGQQPFYFAGTNAFYAAQVDRFSDDDVRTMMATHAQKGVQVMRFFAFSNGDGDGNVPTPIPIQPTIGNFQEQALQRLDLVIAQAQQNGIRVIMPMVNFEPTFGGMQWYVDQVLGTGQDKELFYTDSNVISAYQNYVSMLIQRVNTQTGVRYGDDPTIMSWELANEPHTTDLYEKNRGMQPGALVYNWLVNMSQFVRAQGIKQLISTGEEGYRADGPTDCCFNSWLNRGYKGVDFVRNIGIPDIDFATVHVYPDNWGFDSTNYPWIVPNFVADRASIAHNVSKPIYMEEYGMKQGFLPDRATLLQFLTDGARASNYAGTTVWQVWSQNITENGYDFDYSESGGAAMQQQYAAMKAAD